jgi:hypothetical protein
MVGPHANQIAQGRIRNCGGAASPPGCRLAHSRPIVPQLVLAGHAAQPREAKWSNQPIAMERSSAGRGAVSLVTSSRMARGSAHELIELGQQYESDGQQMD